jgi:hypothetical protein
MPSQEKEPSPVAKANYDGSDGDQAKAFPIFSPTVFTSPVTMLAI